jgi:hypothetical protein
LGIGSARPDRNIEMQRRSAAGSSGLRDAIAALRNRDGGWPYYPGKTSRIEPTCWALLALSGDAAPDVEVLLKWPQQDGWVVDVPGAPVNFGFNAVAGLTLLQRPDGVARARAVATKLLEVKGIRLEQAPMLRQDNSLQAWPWIDRTFSWVEPTSWCLLLLKHPAADLRAAGAARIRVGEQLLIDRVCRDGGWNYGGSNVYGQELWAYVPTTALGLLAMQDRRDQPAVVKSVAHLQGDVGNERSAVALALAAIALRVYGAPVDETLRLLAAAVDTSQGIGSVLGMAMALFAMADNRTPAFRW